MFVAYRPSYLVGSLLSQLNTGLREKPISYSRQKFLCLSEYLEERKTKKTKTKNE